VDYVEERQDGYTDSLGVFIPGQTVSIGQAKFGPEISYRGEVVNGVAIEPFASIEGIWTFSEEGSDDLVVDTLAGNNELRGKVGVGVKAQAAGGTALSIYGSYDGLGDDDFQAVSGQLRLAIPLQYTSPRPMRARMDLGLGHASTPPGAKQGVRYLAYQHIIHIVLECEQPRALK